MNTKEPDPLNAIANPTNLLPPNLVPIQSAELNISGIYGWYFSDIPEQIDSEKCQEFSGLRLLYVGIAPRRPSLKGKSNGTLRKRLRTHIRGSSYGSTLRLSIGCLLSDAQSEQYHIELRRTSQKSYSFNEGEYVLDEWLNKYARVCWIECDNPWEFESHAFQRFSLPLNLLENENHPFYEKLCNLRCMARKNARHKSIVRRFR